MIEVPPLVTYSLLASLIANLLFFDKYTSYDVFYTGTQNNQQILGRTNISVNGFYFNSKMIEREIKSNLNKDSDVPSTDTILVTGWNKTDVDWRLKDWITNLFT